MTKATTEDQPVSIELGQDYPEIRESVRRICADFPGQYWRDLDEKQGYPSEFVAALTEAGFLGALIPEEYGGSGLPLRAASVILEEIHASGCNAGACHAQMYIMGTLLRHGSEEQKQRYLPDIASGKLRLQAFGMDAFRLYPRLPLLTASEQTTIPGASGVLRLGPGQNIQRQLSWATVRDGMIQPLD